MTRYSYRKREQHLPFSWLYSSSDMIISLLETSSDIIISLLVLPDTFLRVVIWFWQDCSILLFYILLRLWRNILMFLLFRALIVLFEGCLQKSCNIAVSFNLIYLIWFRISLFCLYISKLIMFLMWLLRMEWLVEWLAHPSCISRSVQLDCLVVSCTYSIYFAWLC